MEKILIKVPVEIETQALLQALRDGRLFIQAAPVPACDTRTEILFIIDRITPYARDKPLVLGIWQRLLATDERVRSFRYRQKVKNGEVNPCRIAGCVHQMLQMGLYAGEDCNLCVLCRLLFPDRDWDSIRRNCTNYLQKEDYQIITKH